MFVNFSNHPSGKWSEIQLRDAQKWGEVRDVPFPAVDPACDQEALHLLAQQCVRDILALNPQAVLCQGEFGLAFNVVALLQKAGIRCVHACSARKTEETIDDQDNTIRLSHFQFVQFRDY